MYTKGVVSKLFEASARRQCEASEQAIKGLLIKSFFFGYFGVKITPQTTGGIAYGFKWIVTGILLIVGV